jgi:hypothetical protein
MNETTRLFKDFISLALGHPEGPAVARAFDRTLQFDLADGEPFYLEARNGALTVNDGDSGLDWKYRDWRRATCVHTTGRVLREIIAGRRLVTEAFFDRELGFGPRRSADLDIPATAIEAWFYTLCRLAHEQAERIGHERYRSDTGIG